MYRLSNLDDVLRNEHYENDIRYAFQLCLWILKPIGIYPFIYSRANRLERMVSVVLISICCLVVQFVIVPFGYYILFYEKDMNTRIKFLGPLAFCVTSFFKYGYLSLKGRAFERCIVHVERDWRLLRDQDHRAIMIRHVTMSRNLITLCAAFMYTGGLSYHTIMPLLSKNVVNENVTIRPLTYPGYEAFFDIQESPTYEIVYCMHCIYVLVIGNITMAAYSLTAVFTSHACGQIEIQTSRLEHLTNEKRSPRKYASYENHIAIVVRNHVKILRFTKDVEKAMQEILLMEVVMSTLLICLLEYYCMMEWETSDSIAILTYVILLTSFIFSIAIYCYVGELLLGQGDKIATASYKIDWYNLSGRTARGIVLVLAVSKYPPKLTAGKIFDLSLNTFGVVLKSSLVYLNMLRTITDSN
ncbi:odorant receptor 4-like isoform X1 [Hylaeus volcanicus]|uniref:odorant receptor 4-like isoform X1 n=1 Tax=Hylaeus volcanicus TaxID=313075 RepID=UPI0023B78195|nr:odorant receptor 4-like isoform X1 [Hylaeus volcanicus]